MKKIKALFDREIHLLGQDLVNFPWEDPAAYAHWLGQTYYFVTVNTRLLILAGAHVDLENQNLHHRFIDHAKEERGHEVLLKRDLNNLGISLQDIPEFGSTAGLYQSQFYWIQHRHPISLFGYILMLEGLGALYGNRAFEKVVASHGKGPATFLKVHADEDVDHVDKAFQGLAQIDTKVEDLIMENYRISTELYRLMLVDCKLRSQKWLVARRPRQDLTAEFLRNRR